MNKNEKRSLLACQNSKQGRANKNKAMTALAIATAVLGLTTLGFGIGYGVEQSRANQFETSLESVYKSNFYSLLDSVNNLENKVAKTLSASTSTYQRKTLLEASQNASEAEIAVASLPLSASDIEEIVKLVNQVSGYTSTLAEKLVDEDMSSQERETLTQIHESLVALKNQLNQFDRKLGNGFSILSASMDIDGDNNAFSRQLSSYKDISVEYPTMIYDGPFSDSVTNAKIKGLSGESVSKEEARECVQTHFKSAASVEYEGETNGKFETFNFKVTNSSDEIVYVQVAKIQGNILTISGAGEDGEAQIDEQSARQIALEFARENGVEDAIIVWNDAIENDVYFNIAPTQKGIVLYPDLVKVKVNLVSGTVIGYDATSYFTNHTSRDLTKGSVEQSTAKGKVPAEFEIISSRIVLAPLDYNREVVCIEVESEKEGDTYYFFFNAQNGEVENVLRVIKTDNGNLLM